METPWILHAAAVSQCFAVVTGLVAYRRLTLARGFIVAWAAVATTATIAERLIGLRGASNIWVGYITLPMESVLALLALSQWQATDLSRQTIRAAVPGSLLVYLVLVLLVEDTRSFSSVGVPLYGVLGLGAALFTLVTRAIDETEPLVRQDWFWITGGMALYFGALSAVMPMARLLIGSHVELVSRAWQLYGFIGVGANAIIAVGMLCPKPARPEPSGAFSLPSSSASASP